MSGAVDQQLAGFQTVGTNSSQTGRHLEIINYID